MKHKFQIFQPRISLLYNIRHSIPFTSVACGSFYFLTLTRVRLQITFAIRPHFARPPYTIHIDSLRQSLKIGRSRSLFASLSNPSISLRIGAKVLS
nr:MAG TPA: hypothetical protein [Bacteriophage sp.]